MKSIWLASRESGGVWGVTFQEYVQALKHLADLKNKFEGHNRKPPCMLNSQHISCWLCLELSRTTLSSRYKRGISAELRRSADILATLVRKCITILQYTNSLSYNTTSLPIADNWNHQNQKDPAGEVSPQEWAVCPISGVFPGQTLCITLGLHKLPKVHAHNT